MVKRARLGSVGLLFGEGKGPGIFFFYAWENWSFSLLVVSVLFPVSRFKLLVSFLLYSLPFSSVYSCLHSDTIPWVSFGEIESPKDEGLFISRHILLDRNLPRSPA